MKRKFVDTNIFIEVLVRTGEKSDTCRKLLESSEDLWTTPFVILEIEWVLRSFYKLEKLKIIETLKSILQISGLDILNRKEILLAIEYYETYSIDFTDALNTVYADDEGIKEVYSYDEDFNKIGGIKVLKP